MTSPFFYIVFSLAVSCAALSVIFFIAWSSFGRRRYALTWSAAALAGVLQWVVWLNAGLFSSPEVYRLTETVFSIALVTLWLLGHCQRTRCRILPENLFPLAAAVYAVSAWHIVVSPHDGITLGLVPAYAAVSLAVSAYIVVTFRKRTRRSEWAAAFFMVLFAISQAVTAWIALSQGAVRDARIFETYMHFTYLTLPAGYVAMSMSVILMMASDISAKMKRLAVRDQLTDLLNRRGFIEYGEKAFAAARRNGTPLAVIMTDIDRFKYINDRFGHAAGDRALEHFANIVAASRRSEDIVARVGGEEFALLLPGTELRDAMAMADQLCSRIGEAPMALTGVGFPMTASFGVSALSASDAVLDDVIRRADRALYRSKRAGRNRVDLESSQLTLAADGTLMPAVLR